MATHTKTILNHPVSIKAKKALADEVFNRLGKLQDIQKHHREITGVVGGEERSSILWSPFSSPKPLKDPEAFQRDCDEFLSGLGLLDSQDKPVIRAALARAHEIFGHHVPIVDNRRTPEDEQQRRAEQALIREEQAKQAEEQNDQDAQDRERLLKEYHFLEASPDCDGSHDRVRASRNIKAELLHSYPGQTFSVRSESFSMGNSVTISWTDGPTATEVQDLTEKYQYSTFDAMQDLSGYKETGKVFRSLYGGAKYVSTARDVSPGNDRGANYYTPPAAPAIDDAGSVAPVGGVQVQRNEEKQGIEIKFPGKPSEEIRSGLKSHGFRWSRPQGLWWARETAERWAYAMSLTSVGTGPDGTPATSTTPSKTK